MQTFAPYDNIQRSMQALDYRRLGKQRVETKQILKTLTIPLLIKAIPVHYDFAKLGITGEQYARGHAGWQNHPATLQWVGYETALALYHDLCIEEWVTRGYNNTMPFMLPDCDKVVMPNWWDDEKFHSSHRSNLLRKDPIFYGKYGWKDDPTQEYYWPSQH